MRQVGCEGNEWLSVEHGSGEEGGADLLLNRIPLKARQWAVVNDDGDDEELGVVQRTQARALHGVHSKSIARRYAHFQAPPV